MKKLPGLRTGLLILFFVFAAPMPGLAADKAAKLEAVPKTLFENDKVKVVETIWKPGAETESVARGNRVARAVKGGTLTRIYPDGKKDKITYKDGEVKWIDATPAYSIKNETKGTVTLYTVFVK